MRKLLFGLGVTVLLIGGCALFHFGPPGLKAGDNRVLSTLTLTNGSKLFLVARRTGHPIEAYEVSLFRVESDKSVFVNWLGFEDGYWWGASLSDNPTTGKVKIRAFGGLIGEYSVSAGSVRFTDKKEPEPGFKIDGVSVKYPIPREIFD
jgi:hypothetical protein